MRAGEADLVEEERAWFSTQGGLDVAVVLWLQLNSPDQYEIWWRSLEPSDWESRQTMCGLGWSWLREGEGSCRVVARDEWHQMEVHPRHFKRTQ